LPAALLAQLYYERGSLEEAEAIVSEHVLVIEATAMLDCTLRTYVVLARIAASQSNIEHAYTLLEQAANLGHTRRWGRLIAAVLVERLRLYLGEGRLIEASSCLVRLDLLVADYPAPTRCAWSEIEYYRQLANAYIALTKDTPNVAVAILRGLREDATRSHNHYSGVRLGTLLSTALLSADEPVLAIETFRDVVTVCAPTDIYRTILDSGPEVGLLLQRLREVLERRGRSSPLLPYIDRLTAGWNSIYDPAPASADALAGLLSPREHSILQLIARGQSNKEIARSLGIAPETVKSHLKRLFAKLSVDKRAQAIARAQSLGLLNDG
jgi:LuxR family maltose regulon positive regulatory protein